MKSVISSLCIKQFIFFDPKQKFLGTLFLKLETNVGGKCLSPTYHISENFRDPLYIAVE